MHVCTHERMYICMHTRDYPCTQVRRRACIHVHCAWVLGAWACVQVSDCDEIPTAHSLNLLRWCDGWDESGPIQFYTRFYNFKFSLQFAALWHHPQAATKRWLFGANGQRSTQKLRWARTRPSHLRLEDAGWHLSFFADARGVVEKMKVWIGSLRLCLQGLY